METESKVTQAPAKTFDVKDFVITASGGKLGPARIITVRDFILIRSN